MKKIVIGFISILMLSLLYACGGAKVDDATSEKYIRKAEDVVALLNDGQYEELTKLFDDHMKENLPEADLKELEPIIQQSGSFDSIEKSSVEEKDGNYVVVLVVEYTDEKRVYTISFNKNDELSGLYVK